MYEPHKNEKLARRREIRMMRAMNLSESSGSEKTITPEDKWISKYSSWEMVDDTRAGTSTSAAPGVSRDTMEESDDDSDE